VRVYSYGQGGPMSTLRLTIRVLGSIVGGFAGRFAVSDADELVDGPFDRQLRVMCGRDPNQALAVRNAPGSMAGAFPIETIVLTNPNTAWRGICN
jgi:hypothetical protein